MILRRGNVDRSVHEVSRHIGTYASKVRAKSRLGKLRDLAIQMLCCYSYHRT